KKVAFPVARSASRAGSLGGRAARAWLGTEPARLCAWPCDWPTGCRLCNPASRKLRSTNTFGKPQRSLASICCRRWRASATQRASGKAHSPIQKSGGSMDAAVEKSAMRKIYLRLLPFAVFSYILAYIDRINVSFAGLTMRADLNLSATDFGF